jgi:hypothetical protein
MEEVVKNKEVNILLSSLMISLTCTEYEKGWAKGAPPWPDIHTSDFC